MEEFYATLNTGNYPAIHFESARISVGGQYYSVPGSVRVLVGVYVRVLHSDMSSIKISRHVVSCVCVFELCCDLM